MSNLSKNADYFAARKASIAQVPETCPRVMETYRNLTEFFIKYLYDAAKKMPIDAVHEIRYYVLCELDKMKQETTFKLRDGLIEMHMEKMRLTRELENLKCQLIHSTSEAAYLKKSANGRPQDLGTIPSNLCVLSVEPNREPALATTKSGTILKEMSWSVALTYVKIIFIVFLPLVKSIAWLITKCRGKKTRAPKIFPLNNR